MPTPAWAAGVLYSPGALVRPRTAPAVVQSAPTNPNFEAGASGWTLPAGYSIGQHGHAFDGTWSLQAGPGTPGGFVNANVVPVTPGQVIHAQCMVNHGNSGSGSAGGAIVIIWYDAAMVELPGSVGYEVREGSTDVWRLSGITAPAPATAAFAAIGGFMYTNNHPIWMDGFTWDYSYSNSPAGLIYRAVQPLSGYSGSAEPVWPALGVQVTDNEVIWEGVLTSRVTYRAHPILKSGATEPVFSGEVGSVTALDGTILWQAVSRQVMDAKCPHSKIVAIAASKIFAGDGDIVPYSATVNALDWSTVDDAGYLPFGLQTYGSNPVAALGLYRSNLVCFNAAGAQMWQVDQDPANMALLDAVPVPCTYPKSVAPVSNDLALLTSLGVRNLTIAAASTNLQAGDFGKAIDPLVKIAIAQGLTPIGLYYPGSGQYMLFFGSEAFVFTMNGGGKSVSRSRYVFPSAITDWTVLNNDLYLRAGTLVWRFDEDALRDDEQAGTGVDFIGYLAWPYLELQAIGAQVMLHGFDLVGVGAVTVQFGYDQSNFAFVTDPYVVQAETLPGMPIAMPISAPSVQLRLTFAANQRWSWNAARLYDSPVTGR